MKAVAPSTTTSFRWLPEVQPQDVAQEVAFSVERLNVHALLPQGGDVAGGKLVGADFIIQHVDADAGPGAFNQQVFQVLPHGIVLNDEEFDQNIVLRVLDGVVNAREGVVRVNEQAAGIAAADGQAHDVGKRVHDLSHRIGGLDGIRGHAVRDFIRQFPPGGFRIRLAAARFHISAEPAPPQNQVKRHRNVRKGQQGDEPRDGSLRRPRVEQGRNEAEGACYVAEGGKSQIWLFRDDHGTETGKDAEGENGGKR